MELNAKNKDIVSNNETNTTTQKPQNEVVKSRKNKEKNKESEYIRVGIKYYRIAKMPTGKHPVEQGKYIYENVLLHWDKQTIKDDYNNSFVHDVPKYTGFITFPSHTNYQQNVNGFYNQYHKLKFEPQKGECPTTLSFIEHIFGEQYELGLDYLAILYLEPMQILPILSLVSNERSTGKSTFIFWLNELFGSNATVNDNNDFEGRFNSDWTSKLIIAVEETLIEKKAVYERIKSLSTAKSHKTEAKGKDKTEGKFFGKFILCSNFEETFMPIGSDEIRFWVRKIPTFKSKGVKENVKMLATLTSEVPYFLHFLKNRGIKSKNESRMWFTTKQIHTEALQRVMDANMPKVHKALRNYIGEILDTYDLDFVEYPMKELIEIMKEEGLKNVEKSYLKNVLLKDFSLTSSNTKKYKYYDENNEAISKTGRCYRFTRECLGLEVKTETLKKEVSENEQVEAPDNPFVDATEQNTKNLTKNLF
ncbi:primase-helicase family protein [Bernardetia sp. Wsw4-3y2]|uniref:primase-helicase family protein n=1 Tax=Bernardetia sp. Wsw4-3y2 TaxID=3127471 RepID=UPI0030D0F3B4